MRVVPQPTWEDFTAVSLILDNRASANVKALPDVVNPHPEMGQETPMVQEKALRSGKKVPTGRSTGRRSI
jgi:hypothetical protein